MNAPRQVPGVAKRGAFDHHAAARSAPRNCLECWHHTLGPAAHLCPRAPPARFTTQQTSGERASDLHSGVSAHIKPVGKANPDAELDHLIDTVNAVPGLSAEIGPPMARPD
jgi:hypothetical protein